MKRKQITAILMSAIMTVSACMPMGMPTLAAENAGASETAAAATVEAEPEAVEEVDPEPAPEITPEAPTGEEPGAEPQGTEPEDPAPSDDGEDDKEVSGDAATTSAEDEDSAIGATEGSTSADSEIAAEDPDAADQTAEDQKDGEEKEEVQKEKPAQKAQQGDFGSAEDIYVGDSRYVSVTANSPFHYFRFIPEESGDYKFYSESGYDTFATLYDEDENEIISNDDGDVDTDFCLTAYLYEGTTYYFETRQYSYDSAEFTVYLEKDQSSTFTIVDGLEETVDATVDPITGVEPVYLSPYVIKYTDDDLTYVWTKDGETVSTEDHYEFTPNWPTTVECTVSCGDQSQTKTYHIYLNHFSPKEDMHITVTAALGGSVTLDAGYYMDQISADDKSNFGYTWYRVIGDEDEFLLDENGENYKGTTYDASNVTEVSEYYCDVYDNYGNSVRICFEIQVANNFEAWIVDENDPENHSQRATIKYTEGESVTLRAAAHADSGEITYSWYFDSICIDSGSDSYTVDNPSAWDQYICKVSDQYGNTIELTYDLEESYFNVSPEEDYYWLSPGESCTLEVYVDTDDASSVSYQWYRNDAVISGATSATYNAKNKGGTFKCVVTKGTASKTAVFYVTIDNDFWVYAKGGTEKRVAKVGDKATLEVTAHAYNTTGLKYAWYEKDDNDEDDFRLISGATGAKYTTPGITTAKRFKCRVTDYYGNQDNVVFDVGIENHLFAYYEGGGKYDNYKTVKVLPGQGCTLKVAAEADDMSQLQYYWDEFEDNHTNTLVIDPVERNSDYRCYVKDQYGNSSEVYFNVEVENNLKMSLKANGEKVIGDNVLVPLGGSVTLTADVSGGVTDGISYSWYDSREYNTHEGIDSLLIDDVSRTSYVRCSITDKFGNSVSKEVYIKVDNQFNVYPEGFEGAESATYFGKPGEKINLTAVIEALNEDNMDIGWYDDWWNYMDVPYNTRTITAEFGEEEKTYHCEVTDCYNDYKTVYFYLKPESSLTVYAENTVPDENGEYPETVDLYPSLGETVNLHVIAVADNDTVSYHWEKAENYPTSWGEFESDYESIGASGESVSFTAQKATVYRCYVEDTKGNCKVITFRIHVGELSAYPEGAGTMSDGTYNNRAAVNAELNAPTTLTVNTNAAPGANLTYKWTMGPLNDSGWWPLEQGADSTTNTLTVTPAQSARYLCTVTDQYDNQALCYFYVNVDGLTFTTNHGTPALVGDNLYEIHVPAAIGEETTLTTQAGRGSTDDISYAWTVSEKDGYERYGGNTNSVTIVGGEDIYAVCNVTYANGNKAEIRYYITTANQLTIAPVGAAEGQNRIVINAANGEIVPLTVNVSAVDTDSLYYEWFDPEGRRLSTGSSYNLKVTKSGTYKCTVEDGYSNEATAYFVINNGETSIAEAQITLSKTTYNYSGKPNTPTVTVKWNGQTLAEGADKDYTVSYKDNVGAGTGAAVVVKGTGKTLTGTRQVTFTINKIAQKPTIKVGKVTGGKTHSFAVSGAYGTLTAKTGSTAIATASTSGKTVKVKGVKAGKTKLTVTVHGDRNHTDATITAAITVLPGAPTKFAAASAAKGLKLTWEKVPGATNYFIYRNSKKIKTVGNVATFTDTAANTNGTKYTYKIVAKAATGTSPVNKTLAYYKLSKPAITSIKNSASKKMTLKWGKNAKAQGYKIEYALKSNFSDAKSVSVTKNSIVTKTIGSLVKGKTYFVRICSYKKIGSAYSYSMWSATKKIKITK